jgi:hypothetical protein
VWEEVERCDLIIHAGDFTTRDLLVELQSLKEVKAVWGNMDEAELFEVLPEKLIFELAGKRIGVTHGSGAPWNIEKRVIEKFGDDKPDIIIFGHSHRALVKEEKGILLVNPGSPTDRIFTTRLTYAVIEICERVEANIIPVE